MKIGRSRFWYWLAIVLMMALVVAACSPTTPDAGDGADTTAGDAAEEADEEEMADDADEGEMADDADEEEMADDADEEEMAEEEAPEELIPVTFTAGYLPQGNISFVAAYVAQEKGYFAEEGLDVTIEHAAPGTGEQWTRLAGKGIHFTTDPGESFVKRISTTPDQPFRMVSILGQEGDHALMVLEENDISEISDLEGLNIGYKGTGEPPWLLAMLEAEGLSLDDVNIVQVGFDPRVLLPEFGEGRVDALQVFKSNEPDLLQRQGYDVKVFNPEDFGVHFLGQGYVTHIDFIEQQPEMVQGFVNATLRGLEFALNPDNQEEVTDIIMIYAGEDADREHNEFIWQTEIQFVHGPGTEEVGLGYATREQWENMIDVMVDFGSLEEPVPVDEVWNPQFVEQYHENN